MDADGQHPAARIPEFMAMSRAHPRAVIFGLPVFDASAPAIRLHGRKLSNGLANLETLWAGVGDSLCGFRVYPVAPLRDIMERSRWMRHFDFDPEAAVRLCWRGLTPIQSGGAGEVFQRRGGRCFAFQLPARQRAADVDESAAAAGIRGAVAVVAWTRISKSQPPMNADERR